MKKSQPHIGQIETGIEIPKKRNKLNLPIREMESGDSVLIEWTGDADDKHRATDVASSVVARKKEYGHGIFSPQNR